MKFENDIHFQESVIFNHNILIPFVLNANSFYKNLTKLKLLFRVCAKVTGISVDWGYLNQNFASVPLTSPG